LSDDLPLEGAPALVLGAGFGTRLAPLTEYVPKPSIPVLGRPLIGHSLIQLYAGGCREAFVNAHHLVPRLQTTLEAWVQRRLLRLKLRWSIEQPAILGTGGALRLLQGPLSEGGPFLLLNGDSILGLDLPALWAAHQRNRAEGALATLLCIEPPPGRKFNPVRLRGGDRIAELPGMPPLPSEEQATTETVAFCGVHIIEPELIDVLPLVGTESCIVRQGYARVIQGGGDIRAHRVGADLFFHDVGTPDRYLDAQAALLRAADDAVLPVIDGVDGAEALFQEASYAVDHNGREYGSADSVPGLSGAILTPPFFFGPGNRVESGAVIGPDASVGALNSIGTGAVLQDVALWSQVDVGAGERLTHCIAGRMGGERRVLPRPS